MHIYVAANSCPIKIWSSGPTIRKDEKENNLESMSGCCGLLIKVL